MQDCSNYSVLAMELLQSCTKPSIQSVFLDQLWQLLMLYPALTIAKADQKTLISTIYPLFSKITLFPKFYIDVGTTEVTDRAIKNYTRHTFWSCLIRCANMNWIRWVFTKIQSGHDSVHRRTSSSSENLISAAMKQAAPHTCFFFLVFFI